MSKFIVSVRGVFDSRVIEAENSLEAIKKSIDGVAWHKACPPSGMFMASDYCGTLEVPFLAVVEKESGFCDWYINKHHASNKN